MSSNLTGPSFVVEVLNVFCQIRTDELTPRSTQNGVYFLGGASSARGVETTGSPVVISGASNPTVGQVIMAISPTEATWTTISHLSDTAEYILWPPGDTAPDLDLSNAYVLSDGTNTEITVGPNTVQVDLVETGITAGAYPLPTFDVDAKGRITSIGGDNVSAVLPFNFGAGMNVISVSSQNSSYLRYFNQVVLSIGLEFVSASIVAPVSPIVYAFTGLPVAPDGFYLKEAYLMDNTGEPVDIGALYVDSGSPTLLFFTTGGTTATASITRQISGSLIYVPS